MEILEAYELVGAYRGAAELAGCDHHTVKRYVQRRDEGLEPDAGVQRELIIDGFRPKIEELVKWPRGKIRADVVHDRFVAMGFDGSERTTRQAAAEAKGAWGLSAVGCIGRGSRIRGRGCSSIGRRARRWPGG